MEHKWMNRLAIGVVVLGVIGLLGVQAAVAVEEHHNPPAAGDKKADSPQPSPAGMTAKPQAGSGPKMMGMMGGQGMMGDRGMMSGMMGSDMMGGGMMGGGMMRVMMSHMMGGSGGMGMMMGRMTGKMGGMMGPKAGADGMMQMAGMLESLDLTPEQWDKVRTLARERLEKLADMWAQRMKVRIELASLRWEKETDLARIKALFVQDAEAKADMFMAGMTYLRDLKAMLTPEQRKELESRGF